MKDPKRRSLLLINPGRTFRYNWDLEEVCRVMGKKTSSVPLALPLLAALTPPEYAVEIVDEQLSTLEFERKPDLVGITAVTTNLRRAYQLADSFRKRNIPVIMGGPSVSFEPAEASKHADSVVIGEAESVWESLLADFEKGELKAIYKGAQPFPFTKSPVPRWDLIETDQVLTFGVQVSRGCPYGCNFCLVRHLFGKQQRYRDLDNVVEEISSLPPGEIAFADDNLTANKQYARELMEKLIPLGRFWTCQASLETILDRDLLDLMAKAGCTSILVGFESLNPGSLAETAKYHNTVGRYKEGVENAHALGIHVIGSFVVGFDSDTVEEFDRIRRFTEDAGLNLVMLNALSAYPGTDLYCEMKARNRICAEDTSVCNGMYPSMVYKNISREDMFLKCLETYEQIYSYKSIAVKITTALQTGAFGTAKIPVPVKVKFRSLGFLFRQLVLGGGREGMSLLWAAFDLVRKGRTHPAQVVQLLLFIESFRGYLRYVRTRQNDILAMIRKSQERRTRSKGVHRSLVFSSPEFTPIVGHHTRGSG